MEVVKIMVWFFLFVVFVGDLIAIVVCTKFEYRFEYAFFINSVKNYSEQSAVKNQSEQSEAEVHICKLEKDKILDLCREATNDSYLSTTRVEFIEGPPPGPEKLYEFTLSSYEYLDKPPIIEAACSCPTNPLLYLRNKSCGTAIDAVVSINKNEK